MVAELDSPACGRSRGDCCRPPTSSEFWRDFDYVFRFCAAIRELLLERGGLIEALGAGRFGGEGAFCDPVEHGVHGSLDELRCRGRQGRDTEAADGGVAG